MKTFAVIAAVVLLLMAAAVNFAPATLLDARLAAATQGQLRLTGAAGSLWNGRGVVTGESHAWTLPVSWKVDPSALVRGEMAVTLHDGGSGEPRGKLSWRSGALALEGLALTLPAAALDGALTAANVMALGGEIAVDAPHFSWNSGRGDGAASVRWSGARIAGNAGTLALGTVTVNFVPRDGGVVGRVENRGGDVRIDGEVTLDPAGSLGSVKLTPLPSTPPAIAHALGALAGSLGTSDASGAVRVQWRNGTR